MSNPYSDPIIIEDTDEGMQKLWSLCRESNKFALDTYGAAYDDIIRSNDNRLAELDLINLTVDGTNYPFLKSGSNDYYELSKSRLMLDTFVSSGVTPALMFVIPEPHRMMIEGDPACGLSSALSHASDLPDFEIVDAVALAPQSVRPSDLIRAFDSHPSTGFYHLCARAILDSLGLGEVPLSYQVYYREYPCDLASRFLNLKAPCLFVSDHYTYNPAQYLPLPDGGVATFHRNVEAPIREKLLLIGDSHSYSALAPIMSYVFQDVSFIWASRRDGFHPFQRLVEHIAGEATYIVEETAERFFLRNFCSAHSG